MTEPIGKIWLSCLIMVVIPLIVSSLALGVAGLGDLRKLGRMGAVTLVCFLGLTTLATILGLTVMNVLRPGDDLDQEVKSRLMETYRGEAGAAKDAMGLSGTTFGVNLFVKIVPRNPWEFFRKIRLVMLTAFSTSSSNATLPTTMEVGQQELGLSREVAGFVLPLGATLMCRTVLNVSGDLVTATIVARVEKSIAPPVEQ